MLMKHENQTITEDGQLMLKKARAIRSKRSGTVCRPSSLNAAFAIWG